MNKTSAQAESLLRAELDGLADLRGSELLGDGVDDLRNGRGDDVGAHLSGELDLAARLSDESLDLVLVGGTRKVVL